MKSLSALALVLILPLFVIADEPPINTLTPKEIADGWILLFDGKTTFGWTSPNDSKWTIVDGMLAPQKGKPGILVTTTAFRDFELVLDYQKAEKGEMIVLCCCDAAGKVQNSPLAIESPRSIPPRLGTVRILVRGGKEVQTTYLKDGKEVSGHGGELGEAATIPSHISLLGNDFIVRTIKLKPLSAKPVFNGKNLDGWKEHPNRKSKFSVTKEGWLSLKDGPGDLQTTSEWADFVLQAECKTNGKNLNSGIFFRCLPGQYQMGYEAQIHNGFGPEKDYTLEIFDPKTNKLIDKKKAAFTATDYGTGAIYRRMPARFQAAKDNEWFTMTVAAQGRHLATWVNGMQTVDWTDNRPLGENARKGAYLKKGPISIQGHDPTTDLLFRNFRIAELPPAGK